MARRSRRCCFLATASVVALQIDTARRAQDLARRPGRVD